MESASHVELQEESINSEEKLDKKGNGKEITEKASNDNKLSVDIQSSTHADPQEGNLKSEAKCDKIAVEMLEESQELMSEDKNKRPVIKKSKIPKSKKWYTPSTFRDREQKFKVVRHTEEQTDLSKQCVRTKAVLHYSSGTDETSNQDILDTIYPDRNIPQLQQVVSTHGLVVRYVPSEDNCPYHVVADQMRMLVKNWQGDHRSLRDDVVRYLSGKDRVGFTQSDNWGDYLQQQSEDGAFSDHIVRTTLAEVCERQIKVYYCNGSITVIGEKSSNQPIRIGHIPDIHYVSLWRPDTSPQSGKRDLTCYLSSSSSSEKIPDVWETRVQGLVKTLGWRQLTGPLTTWTRRLFVDMYHKIMDIKFESGMKFYLTRLLDSISRDSSRPSDVPLMMLIQGYGIAHLWTEDYSYIKKLKSLDRKVNTYTMANHNIVAPTINVFLINYYLNMGKHGKVYHCGIKTISSIQSEAPSSWTALIHDRFGLVCDVLAQLSTKSRQKYRTDAVQCYNTAREHWLYRQCERDGNYLYRPILCTLFTVIITLDMPTLYTISVFSTSHITLQRGSTCTITMCDVIRAQEILSTVTPQVHTLDPVHQPFVTEGIAIARLFVHLRLTKLHVKSEDYSKALDTLQQGREVYRDWEDKYKDIKYSSYNRTNFLKVDLYTLYEQLEEEIYFKCPCPRPAPVPFVLVHGMPSSGSEVETVSGDFSDQLENNPESPSSDVYDI